jgi:subtilisin
MQSIATRPPVPPAARRLRLPVVALLAAGAVLVAGGDDAAAEPPRSVERITGSYIVVYEPSAARPGEKTDRLEKSKGFRSRYRYGRALKGFAARLSAKQVQELRADPDVAFVSPDGRVQASDAVTVAPGDSVPTGVRRMEAGTASTVREPSSANVAVIDTGIDLAHPDLDAVDGTNCVTPGTRAQDDNGHGTHVAGTIGARNDGSGVVGVAPGTRTYAVKVLDGAGSGTWSQIICGIDWVTATRTDADPANDVAVANMSLGGAGQPVAACSTTTDPMHKAICASTAAGVTYVVAAGNSGWDFDYPSAPDTPAAYPEVLTVAAMSDGDGRSGAAGGAPACASQEGDDRYASFSNFAATSAGASHTIAAPGVCIRSTWPGGGHATISGTSMAAPHIAGAAALCLEEGGEAGPCAGLTPRQIVAKMRDDAQAHTTAAASYGFTGDPAHAVSGAYFGYLTWAPAADATAPEVTSVSPADGATGVSAATNVSVTFSEAMDKAATEGAFSLVRSTDGSVVSGTFAWANGTLTFDPSSALAAGAFYRARLTTAAEDSAGNALATEKAWTFTIAPASTATTLFPESGGIYYGSLRSGDLSRLASDDNGYRAINSTTSGTRLTDWYGRVYRVPNSLATLKVGYKGKSSATCDQSVWIYNWTAGRWAQLGARKVGTTEVEVTVAPSGTLADYVSGTSGDGDVAVRIRCSRGDSVSFYTSADLLRITYTR